MGLIDWEDWLALDADEGEQGGRTCLCNTGPKCRHEHRLKQDPNWTVEQHPDGAFTWTTPSGRQYTTEPTEYPI